MIWVRFLDSDKFIEANFSWIKDGEVVQLTGKNIPQNTSGFEIMSSRGEVIGNYKLYTTIYRKVKGGYQFSNDGSQYVEPRKNVTISVDWDDQGDAAGIRPDEVTVKVGEENYLLREEWGWKYTFYGVDPKAQIVITEAPDIDKYEKFMEGATVRYYHEWIDPTPTLEDRVNDLEIALCEIVDAIAEE